MFSACHGERPRLVRKHRLALAGACVLLDLCGCRAGPAPGDAPQAREGDSPSTWSSTLDDAVFGSWDLTPSGAGKQAKDPEESRRLLELALGALMAHRLEEAAGHLEKAAEKAPPADLDRAQRALADVYLALRRDEEALSLYLELVRRGTRLEETSLYENLAVAYYRLGDAALSRKAAERALALDPAHPEGLKTLGLVEILEGNTERGAERLREALASGRSIPEAEVALAELEETSGNPVSALVRYRSLLRAFEGEKTKDYHRRWKDLFYPCARSTAEELEARIARLEAALTGKEIQGGGEAPFDSSKGESHKS